MSVNLTRRWAERIRDQRLGDSVAFLVDDDAWTFDQVLAGSARIASGYRSAGLTSGDRVLLALPDSVELVWCLLGAWQAGIVAVPVNVQMSRDDLARDVATAEPTLIVVDPETAGWLDDAALGPTTRVETLAAAKPDTRFDKGGDAPALALFTSGTTGAPKLCFFRHDDLVGIRLPEGL